MSFVSFAFLLFMIILLPVYYLCPKNKQWLLLLCGSLVFYVWKMPYQLLFLLFSTVTGYVCGRRLEKTESEQARKVILAVTVLANVIVLAVTKYFGLPISILGISFYTFMLISYLADVYWGFSASQGNFAKFLLYLSFFPQITQGPINSYSEMSTRLYARHNFDKERFVAGLYRIVCGLFKKLVIASRLSVYVDRVYSNLDAYGGLPILLATFFYAFQMYCDFSGYMDMAIGISELFGISMAENFNLPYFSQSIPEYWRRWHITLGTWFRSYVYYPVIRSTPVKSVAKYLKAHNRKSAAKLVPTIIGLLVVWILTGIWHGSGAHYVVWGLWHGLLIIGGVLLTNVFTKQKKALHINEDSKAFCLFRIVRTFILVDISYIFFRAESLSDIKSVFVGLFTRMHFDIASIKDAILPFTEDNTSVSYAAVCAVALLMLVASEVLKYRSEASSQTDVPSLYDKLIGRHKYLCCAIMLLMILLFGVFGQSSFIYAKY